MDVTSPLLVTSGAVAATWGLHAYDRRVGVVGVDVPRPGTIEGSAWYQGYVHRLRATSGWLMAASAREVLELQRGAAVRRFGHLPGDPQSPAVGMRHGELRELIDGWLRARALVESELGLIAGDVEWWVGGRAWAAVETRPLRTRWNVHAGADASGAIATYADIAGDLASAAEVRETWRVLSDHARLMDTHRAAEPLGGPVDRVVGAFGDAAAAAGGAAAGAIGAVLRAVGDQLVKVAIVLGGGYLLVRAVRP